PMANCARRSSSHRLRDLAALGLLGLAVAGMSCLVAAPARADEASAASGHEALMAAKARLGSAMDSVRRSHFAMSDEDKAHKRDMLADATTLHEQASAAGARQDTSALVSKMNALSDEMVEFADRGAAAAAPETYAPK